MRLQAILDQFGDLRAAVTRWRLAAPAAVLALAAALLWHFLGG